MMMGLFIKENILRIVLGVAGSWENKGMKIELIKLKFNDTCSYKYKPFKHCCEAIQDDKAIIFTNEDLFSKYDCDDYDVYVPQFCTSYSETFTSYEDEFENTENYPIKFCPHCGEKIQISIVDEIDMFDKYEELTKQRYDLLQKSMRTDSKKEEFRLRERIKEIDNKINDFYELGEWKGEY